MNNFKSKILFSVIIPGLFNLLLSNFCFGQFSTATVPQINFHESEARVLVYSKYFSVYDSVQVIDLSVSVKNNVNATLFDSVWFALKGAENLKLVRSSVRTYDKTSYSLEYVFKRTKEPFPPVTLAFNSRQKLLGKIKLEIDNNFIRLATLNQNDILSSYTYRISGCIYVNGVKELVAPKLPENDGKPFKFKHQLE